jgi:site-specific DNA recombinase
VPEETIAAIEERVLAEVRSDFMRGFSDRVRAFLAAQDVEMGGQLMAEKLRAAGYVRVSTEEQRKNGWNLGADRERIENTISERGWTRVDIYDNGGLQGDDPNRPEFNRMLAEIDTFDVLIMRDLDRFSRKLAIYAAAVDELVEAGITLYEFDGDEGTKLRQLRLENEDDRALADVKAVFAQLEKAKIKRRVRQAMGARARQGHHSGGAPPYGYRWKDKKLTRSCPPRPRS